MSDRGEMNRKISARDNTIAAEREQENIVLANLGQSVFDSEPADVGVLEKNRKIIIGISDEIQNLEKSLRKLLADDEKRSVIQEEQKSLKVELRNMKNKEEPLLEELGRTSWELWKSGRTIDEGLEEALSDLIRAEERLHAAEDAELRSGNNSGSRAAKFILKGKALLLAGRRKTASSALERLWERAGRNLCESIPPEAFSDTPAAVSASALKVLSDRRDEISRRTAALTEDFKALDSSMSEIPGKGSVRKRVGWIENSLELSQNELDVAFRALGKTWLENNSGRKSSNTAVEQHKKEWTALNRRITTLEDEQNAISAHREFMESEESRDFKAGQVSKLEEDLKSRQIVLKGLKKELTAIEKKLADQKEKLPPMPEDIQT